MKVVINNCYGGFGLSDEAYEWLIKNKGWTTTTLGEDGQPIDKVAKLWISDDDSSLMWNKYYPINSERDEPFRCNPDVVEVIETLGEKADGKCASLKVIEIPDDISWYVSEYDGMETIHEEHRSWR